MTAIADTVSCGSARSTWMWSSGPASQGQFSGNGWREQVMTRQPAAEKRFTVAWPMPRLAPVSSKARRGGVSLGLTPGPASAGAAELDAITQPIGPILPEFDGERQQAVAGPVRRPRDGPDREFRHVERDHLLEGH